MSFTGFGLLHTDMQPASQGKATSLWREHRASPLGHDAKCQSFWDQPDLKIESKNVGGELQKGKREILLWVCTLCFGPRILVILKDPKTKNRL